MKGLRLVMTADKVCTFLSTISAVRIMLSNRLHTSRVRVTVMHSLTTLTVLLMLLITIHRCTDIPWVAYKILILMTCVHTNVNHHHHHTQHLHHIQHHLAQPRHQFLLFKFLDLKIVCNRKSFENKV